MAVSSQTGSDGRWFKLALKAQVWHLKANPGKWKKKVSASNSPLVLCKLAALWNSSLSWNTTREKQNTHVRNAIRISRTAAGTRKNLSANCGSSTSPDNVTERMQSGFLHPVRFPTTQCRVKICIVCVSYATFKWVFSLSWNTVVSALFRRNALLQNSLMIIPHSHK